MTRQYPVFFSLFYAGLLLVIGVVAYAAWNAFAHTSVAPRQHTATDFQFMLGGGTSQGKEIVVNKFQNDRAVIALKFSDLQAKDYAFLHFSLTAALQDESLPVFFWRKSGSPTLHTLVLEDNPLDIIELRRQPEWSGRINEYGFMFKQNAMQEYRVGGVTLEGVSTKNLLLNMLSDWLEFEIWQQHSTHYTKLRKDRGAPALVLLVAAWMLLAMFILVYLTKRTGLEHCKTKLALVLLAGWLLLDARWLYNLLHQAEITQQMYTGKSEQGKYAAGMDVAYFTYAERLKRTLLPKKAVPIFIINDVSAAKSYFRARLQYLLIPHKVFNYDQLPRSNYAQIGGYLLVLAGTTGIVFDPNINALRWDGGVLPANLVDQDPLGFLFKLH